MLLSAPPLEHCPPRNVSLVMKTGLSRHWASARIAAPPRSGPTWKQRLLMNREFTTLSWPPRVEDGAAAAAAEARCCSA